MEFLKVIIENWVPVFVVLVAVVFTAHFILNWLSKPKAEHIADLKEWLKFAVVEAEKELGRKTGEIKLRKVYDKAVSLFPWVALFVTFEDFKLYVDEALEWMEEQLATNNNIANYVGRE